MFSLDGAAATSDAEYLETEAQVLQTDNLAIDVVRKMHLDRYPELTGDTKDLAATAPSPSDAEQLTATEKAALGGFRARLKVKRDTSSRLIQIGFSSHDPELAAQVTNTVVADLH